MTSNHSLINVDLFIRYKSNLSSHFVRAAELYHIAFSDRQTIHVLEYMLILLKKNLHTKRQKPI